MSDQQTAPTGLIATRNAAAAAGAIFLLVGLIFHEPLDDLWQVPLWLGMLSLATALGIALVTTGWRSMGTATKVIIIVCAAAVAAVMVDVLS